MTAVRAKKHLGQHFLREVSVARRVAESLPPVEGIDVLEVGPGTGMLTQFLLENPSLNLTAVEIDRESVSYLRGRFPELRVVEGDVLRIDVGKLFAGKFCIIGNFPYNISTQILFKLLDWRDSVPALCGMFQKEVAERIASPPGGKTYGILSVLLQAYYRVEYLFTVPQWVFDPPPKVLSAVVRLTRNEVECLPCDETLFRTVVKTAFNRRRKTLRNSLAPLLPPHHPLHSDPMAGLRAEQLGVQDFVRLTNILGSTR